jgi:hypothetical protein
MKKQKTLLLGAVYLTSLVPCASEIKYDIGLGFESSSIVGDASNAEDHNHVGMFFMSPKMDVSISRIINGPVAAFARVSGAAGSSKSGFTPAVQLEKGREFQAMAGFSYDLGTAVYAVAPVVSIADYTYVSGENDEQLKNLSAIGLNGSVDICHDKVGVRFYAQHMINSKFSSWGDESLSENLGKLGTSVTKVGVSVFGDEQLIA